MKEISKISTASKQYSDAELNINNSNLEYFISPNYRLHLFDPDRPLYYDFGPEISFKYTPKPGIIISGTGESSWLTTFDEISRGAKGSLPHVRTDIKKYANVTDPRIRDLSITSHSKLKNNLYSRITGGYLESMFAGISSEILHSPSNSSLSIGGEINYVKARSFDQIFGLRDIKGMSNLNGHISTYWDTNFHNYLVQLDYGKYLAGDVGSTLTITRNFPNGWKVGGFFSETSASEKEFGEGSFDKGFFIRIPYQSFMPYETRGGITEIVRPILGDGGARLSVPYRLHSIVSDKSSRQISNSWSKLWR